jgi:hypothetical protein
LFDALGWTALDHAIEKNLYVTISLLLSLGATKKVARHEIPKKCRQQVDSGASSVSKGSEEKEVKLKASVNATGEAT